MTTDRGVPVKLVARDSERARLGALLASARDGESVALVVHGEAGIGKTALLDDLVASAVDFEIARVDGVEVERDLAFAGAHRVLAPHREHWERLPAPQRSALDSAFGLDVGPPPSMFLIGLAVLTILSDVASGRPLLCIFDDAHWLDPESRDVLAFAARRLHADAIALVFGVRDGEGPLDALEGFEHLQVSRLPDADATALLDASALPSDPKVAARIVAEASGNPLALVELSRQLTDAQRSGETLLPEHLPLSERLEQRFLVESRRMSGDAQLLLLVAAADGSADAVLVGKASASLGAEVTADLVSEVGNFLRFEPEVAFRHPLIRSAVYGGAPEPRRRAVHGALAAALDKSRELDRHAWHLAAATPLPDEDVASELDDGAERAQSRGGYSAEAAFRIRAADLSVDADRRRRRLLAAGRAALNAGAVATAEEQWQKIKPETSDGTLEAETLRLRGTIHIARDEPAEAAAAFVQAARRLTSLDRTLARKSLLDATNSHLVTQLVALPDTGLGAEIARLVFETRGETEDGALVRDFVLEAWALRSVGDTKASSIAMRQAADLLCNAQIDTELMIRLSALGFMTAFEIWDDRALEQWPARVMRTMRDSGALSALRVATIGLATVNTLFGRFHEAEIRHAETAELTRALGGNPDLYRLHSLELAAWRGLDAEIRPTCEALVRAHDDAPGDASAANTCQSQLIVLDIASGRYREALPHAVRLFTDDPPQFGACSLPSMVEIAARAGDNALAQQALERLEHRAECSGTSWALGLLARSRALLADDTRAEPYHREAVELLEETSVATDLARAEMLYGEWLRRQKRRADARIHLRRAFEMFNDMGARGFADRASRELVATGEHVRRDPIESRRELTPQELHVARLAAARATNREIAAQLFISANTVEYHLRKVFRKLGVTSRRELEAALPQ